LTLLLGSFDDGLKRHKCSTPKLLEVHTQLIEPSGIHRIDPTVPRRVVNDQARVFQHPEVLAHGRTTDWQSFRQLAHCPRTLDHPLKDPAPCRVSERRQPIPFVSKHAR